MTLYRQEVIEARKASWMGVMRLVPPRLGWAFLTLGLGVLGMCTGLLFFGHYTRHETVNGQLISSKGVLPVTTPFAGTVVRVMVADGARVLAGAALVEVSGESSSQAFGATRAGVIEQLRRERAALEADRVAQQRTQLVQEQQTRSALSAARTELMQSQRESALQSKRADAAKLLLDRWSSAASAGVIAQVQFLEQRDRALDSEARVVQLERQSAALGERVRQLQSQLDALPNTATLEQNDNARRVAEITQQLSVQEAQRDSVLTAPVSGTVVNLRVLLGEAVAEHAIALSVIPDDSVLQAELWVPSKAIGFIAVGSPVVLRYSAFAFERFGQYGGTVRAISAGALPLPEPQGRSEFVGEGWYRVVVDLDRQTVGSGASAALLKPGMALEAHVALDRHQLIDFVLAPFRRVAAMANSPAVQGQGA